MSGHHTRPEDDSGHGGITSGTSNYEGSGSQSLNPNAATYVPSWPSTAAAGLTSVPPNLAQWGVGWQAQPVVYRYSDGSVPSHLYNGERSVYGPGMPRHLIQSSANSRSEAFTVPAAAQPLIAASGNRESTFDSQIFRENLARSSRMQQHMKTESAGGVSSDPPGGSLTAGTATTSQGSEKLLPGYDYRREKNRKKNARRDEKRAKKAWTTHEDQIREECASSGATLGEEELEHRVKVRYKGSKYKKAYNDRRSSREEASRQAEEAEVAQEAEDEILYRASDLQPKCFERRFSETDIEGASWMKTPDGG